MVQCVCMKEGGGGEGGREGGREGGVCMNTYSDSLLESSPLEFRSYHSASCLKTEA